MKILESLVKSDSSKMDLLLILSLKKYLDLPPGSVFWCRSGFQAAAGRQPCTLNNKFAHLQLLWNFSLLAEINVCCRTMDFVKLKVIFRCFSWLCCE